ncbi:MAG: Asp-tRNA(Asn)/Glu-tRNA(Gln) amidotransferase subunit GatC [Planctomycetota bacterium]|nr:Asp-tRNA(Asn)/Glu-tRNA(Gln) amidotransferase subunit GatC [Planctomycetota bacterium]
MVDPQVVRQIAELARLGLDPSKNDSLVSDLVSLLEHFQGIQEVDTEGVEPLAHAHDLPGTPEEDVVEPFKNPRDRLTPEGAHSREGFIVVQRILDETIADDLQSP